MLSPPLRFGRLGGLAEYDSLRPRRRGGVADREYDLERDGVYDRGLPRSLTEPERDRPRPPALRGDRDTDLREYDDPV